MMGFTYLALFYMTDVKYEVFDIFLGALIAVMSTAGTLCVC